MYDADGLSQLGIRDQRARHCGGAEGAKGMAQAWGNIQQVTMSALTNASCLGHMHAKF